MIGPRRVAIVATLLAAGCGDAADAAGDGPAPDVRALAGDAILHTLEQLRSRPLLVNFWAMWCVPCVAELPDLVAVTRTFRERGGEVVGISFDMAQRGVTLPATLDQLDSFLRARAIEFPILLLADGDPRRLNDRFDLPGNLPVTLAIDRDGRVVEVHEGAASRADFERLAAAAFSAH